VAAARAWTRAARELGATLTLISSDAVFSGPWMFHGETSTAFCESASARTLRALESATIDECPQALVVRTHAYGWSPVADGLGWIEGILGALESDRPGVFDCIPHATPILAADLADLLDRAWQANLIGLYHIGGAERTNPHRFVQNLAGVFDLTPPRATLLAPPESVQNGFAQGESSLHTRSVCRALGVSMPILIEGLKRLRDQRDDGFDRRFQGSCRFAASRVA
jgi:dTDP-4-dehydrorhamnose reductase